MKLGVAGKGRGKGKKGYTPDEIEAKARNLSMEADHLSARFGVNQTELRVL